MGKGFDTGANKIIVKINPTEEQLKSYKNTRADLSRQIEIAHSELAGLKTEINTLIHEYKGLGNLQKQQQEEYDIKVSDYRKNLAALEREKKELIEILEEKLEEANKIKSDYTAEENSVKHFIDENNKILNATRTKVEELQLLSDKLNDQKGSLTKELEKSILAKTDAIEHKTRFGREILKERKDLNDEREVFEQLKEETFAAIDTSNERISSLTSIEARLDQKKIDIAALEKRAKESDTRTIELQVWADRLEDQAELQKIKHINLIKRNQDLKAKEKLIKDTFKEKGGKRL